MTLKMIVFFRHWSFAPGSNSIGTSMPNPSSINQNKEQYEEFNLLINKLSSLQKEQEKITQELNKYLQFYYEKILPKETALLCSMSERIKASYKFYKTQNCLSPKGSNLLKQFILNDMKQVLAWATIVEMSEDLQDIFNELNETPRTKTEPTQHEQMQEAKKKIHQQEEELGHQQSFRDVPKPKRCELNEQQKKSIHKIYKRLAKALHPDLEQDVKLKVLKEELMKKLTCAYDARDLHALLALEMEWTGGSIDQDELESSEQIMTYREILNNQVESLKKTIDTLIFQPRYGPIQRFYKDRSGGLDILVSEQERLTKEVKTLQELVNRLHSSEAETIFKDYLNML
jgi:hypothetical protein